jgi:hypothetical protein
MVCGVGTASASIVTSCAINGGVLATGNCYAFASFSTSETLDWQTAYGTADAGSHSTTYDPYAQGSPWLSAATGSGLTVGATFGAGYTGDKTISRVDNFGRVLVDGVWETRLQTSTYANWQNYLGMFDAPPDADAGSPGDHLLQTTGGVSALELQFNRGISGIMFRISTGTSGDVNATIAAYAVDNPTGLDTPLTTYTINAHSTSGPNPAGTCATLANNPPTVCNTAPYIGVEGLNFNIRSIVISTPDTAGLFIDTLYFNDPLSPTDAPEPSTFGFAAISVFGMMGGRRWLLNRRQA